MDIFKIYIAQIAKVKDELEHSGRTYLQNLLQQFAEKTEVIHEPKRDKNGKGAPDFKFVLNGTDIGFLENKKIGENLDEVLKSKQIEKYKTLTDNLILTDYLRWIWIYKDEVIADEKLCGNDFILNNENCEKVAKIITNFLAQKPQKIGKIDSLAVALARPAVYIKEGIEEELKNQIIEKSGQLWSIYQTFRGNLIKDLSVEEFSDSFTQTLVYSLFIAKLENISGMLLTVYNIDEFFPSSFALVKDLLSFVGQVKQEKYKDIAPFIERLLHIVNNIDSAAIGANLSFKNNGEKDPYIYFYEDFLAEYDKNAKVDRGVYYTPPEVVTFIVRTLDDVLKNEFAMEDGLGTIGIEVLDFACGTGTFLLELYKQVLGRIPNKKLGENSKEGTIINHLLQKVYGFELMIAPYAIAHLKLSQYLKQEGFDFKKPIQKGLAQDKKRDEYFYRIPVFLTNTLENLDWEYKQKRGNQVTLPFFSFIEEVAKEGAKAQKIKDSKNVFVIMGNPPYNGTSMNHSDYITNLMQDYFAIDGIKMKEQNSKWVNDDYVKFIRFAEDKIAKHPHGGVVGVITPHGFLDNPTFRAMRYHLMQTFDKMYFVDLHGNTRKKEVDLEGGKDENVFDIMQGVCISIFVKTGEIYNTPLEGESDLQSKSVGGLNNTDTTKPLPDFAMQNTALPQGEGLNSLTSTLDGREVFETTGGGSKCKIYTIDIYGKRKQKNEQLLNSNIDDCEKVNLGWQEVNPVAPFYLFKKQDEDLREEYDKFISLEDIFLQQGVGTTTAHDEFVINDSKEKLIEKFVDFKKSEKSVALYEKFNVNKKEGWDILKAWDKFQQYSNEDIENLIQPIHYRPFDAKKIIYEDTVVWRTVKKTMQHMLKPNIGLNFVRRIKTGDNLGVFISDTICDDALAGMSSTSVAPLYLYDDFGQKTPNFKPEFLKYLTSTLAGEVGGTTGGGSNRENKKPLPDFAKQNTALPQGEGLNSLLVPEKILAYIYAVLHSPIYRTKYLEFLKIDFPRINFDVGLAEFTRLSTIGQELIEAHLMKITPHPNPLPQGARWQLAKFGEAEWDEIRGEKNYTMEKLSYDKATKRLYFNASCYFANVSEEIYNFKIGGYQVLDKYLKSRKGLDILADLSHIQKIIKSLQSTIEIMQKIDTIIYL